MESYRELVVWQKAKDLAVRVYRSTESVSMRERYGLAAQIRSSAVSIPSNIAEGYGRRNRKEYVQFLGIANGSLNELETQLIIAQEVDLMPDTRGLIDQAEEVGRILHALIRSLTPLRSP